MTQLLLSGKRRLDTVLYKSYIKLIIVQYIRSNCDHDMKRQYNIHWNPISDGHRCFLEDVSLQTPKDKGLKFTSKTL